MNDCEIVQPGLLSLLHDGGRFGKANLGLTTGGPADPWAASVANQLLGNEIDSTHIELSFGGLEIRALAELQIAVTGATTPAFIDGESREMWEVLTLKEGETLQLGYSENGCRSYLAVRGGFLVEPQFGSTSTVVREGVGGLSGAKLAAGDILSVADQPEVTPIRLAHKHRQNYPSEILLRVVPGYQVNHFSSLEQQRFYTSEYTVSDRSDRMGYRLEGAKLNCDIEGILSEGIAMGAIQVPADGQPIVLLNDRQTIGGYPKIGCVLSTDCAALAQLRPGGRVRFKAISEQEAHNALHLAQAQRAGLSFEACTP